MQYSHQMFGGLLTLSLTETYMYTEMLTQQGDLLKNNTHYIQKSTSRSPISFKFRG